MIGMSKNSNQILDQLTDAADQVPVTMAAQPAPVRIAPVNPHAALTAPIGPPRMSANELGAPLGRTNELGDALPDSPAPAETPKMSPLAAQQEHINRNLMADYKKDSDPYGSADNHPGFFGKFLHGLNVATGGVNRRGYEEQGLENRLQSIAKEQSAEDLQAAETGKTNEETEQIAPNAESARRLQGSQTRHIDDESGNLENPQPELQHFATDNGFYSFNPKTGEVTPLTYQGKPITPSQKLTYQTVDGPDGKPHVYGIDAKGNKVQDLGEHYEKPTTVNVNAANGELDRLANPYRKQYDAGSAQLDKIDEAANMLQSGNAEAQALAVPKVMTAIISGQGSGVRVTQAELNAIAKARGIQGNLEGTVQEWEGQGHLTPQQRQQLAGVLHDVRAKVAAKQQALDAGITAISNAPDRASALREEQNLRHQLAGGGTDNSAQPKRPANVPEGYTFKDGPKGKGWYKP